MATIIGLSDVVDSGYGDIERVLSNQRSKLSLLIARQETQKQRILQDVDPEQEVVTLIDSLRRQMEEKEEDYFSAELRYNKLYYLLEEEEEDSELTNELKDQRDDLKDEIKTLEDEFLTETLHGRAYNEIKKKWINFPEEVKNSGSGAIKIIKEVTTAVSTDDPLFLFNPEVRKEDLFKLQDRLTELGYSSVLKDTEENIKLMERGLSDENGQSNGSLIVDLVETHINRNALERKQRLFDKLDTEIKQSNFKFMEGDQYKTEIFLRHSMEARNAYKIAKSNYEKALIKQMEQRRRLEKERISIRLRIESLKKQIEKTENTINEIKSNLPRKSRTITLIQGQTKELEYKLVGGKKPYIVKWIRENDKLADVAKNIRTVTKEIINKFEARNQVLEIDLGEGLPNPTITVDEWTKSYELSLPEGLKFVDIFLPLEFVDEIDEIERKEFIGEERLIIKNATARDVGRYTLEVTDAENVKTKDNIFVRVLAPKKRLSIQNQSLGFTERLYDTSDNDFGSAKFNRWRQISIPEEEFLRLYKTLPLYKNSSVLELIENGLGGDKDLQVHVSEKWSNFLGALQTYIWERWLIVNRDAVYQQSYSIDTEEPLDVSNSVLQSRFEKQRKVVFFGVKKFWSTITVSDFIDNLRPKLRRISTWSDDQSRTRLLEQQLMDTRPRVKTRDIPTEERTGSWTDKNSSVFSDINNELGEMMLFYPWIRPSERLNAGIDYEGNAPRREDGLPYTLEELQFFFIAQKYDKVLGEPSRDKYAWVFNASKEKPVDYKPPEYVLYPVTPGHEEEYEGFDSDEDLVRREEENEKEEEEEKENEEKEKENEEKENEEEEWEWEEEEDEDEDEEERRRIRRMEEEEERLEEERRRRMEEERRRMEEEEEEERRRMAEEEERMEEEEKIKRREKEKEYKAQMMKKKREERRKKREEQQKEMEREREEEEERRKFEKEMAEKEKLKKLSKSNMKSMRSVYSNGYEFPEWSIQKFLDNYVLLTSDSKIYYTDPEAKFETLKKLATEREPTNIAMNRKYSKNKLKDKFGYDEGYYGQYYKDNGKLAPNFSVYTPAFVELKDGTRNTRIYIINAIGLALDDTDQPDYKEFKKGTLNIEDFYYNVFKQIYRCASDNNMKKVVMSLVGANNFATLYTGYNEKNLTYGAVGFQLNVWAPVFLKFIKEKKPNVETVFMGARDSTALKFINDKSLQVKYKDIGFFPGFIEKKDFDTQTTLIVNAWDPWSMIGNGNNLDNSLDGFIGRKTTTAVVGWPLSNWELQKRQNYILVKDSTEPKTNFNINDLLTRKENYMEGAPYNNHDHEGEYNDDDDYFSIDHMTKTNLNAENPVSNTVRELAEPDFGEKRETLKQSSVITFSDEDVESFLIDEEEFVSKMKKNRHDPGMTVTDNIDDFFFNE